MSKFMLIIGGADLDKRSSPELLEHYMKWIKGLQDGAYLSSGKLQEHSGRRLTVRGGEVIDGPFIESKDAVGGYLLVEVKSLDEATAIARGCPVLHLQNGYVEVRMIEERPAALR